MTADPDDYLPVPEEAELLACLRCGLVTLDDSQALELHEVLHLLLAKLSPSGSLSQAPPQSGAGPTDRARQARQLMDNLQRLDQVMGVGPLQPKGGEG